MNPRTPLQPASDEVAPSRLSAAGVTGGYDRKLVLDDVDIEIPEGSFTAIIGPNACGKSTLLRTLARLLRPREGSVVLDGADIRTYGAKELARRLGLLPQTPLAPDGITVSDLVSRGRHPHQSVLAQWSARDEEAVGRAMTATRVVELADRQVSELSGGQRQRVWIAMALAQETGLLLLDEPTTYLDITHQLEVLELIERLRAEGRTVVAVLHDLNQAARYAGHLVAMRDGRILAQGDPMELITAENVERVFGLRSRVIHDPDTGSPVVLPRASMQGLQEA